MTTATEKRISPRFPKNAPVVFSFNPGNGAPDADATHAQKATIIDISATGMGIFTTSHISTGDNVYFPKDQPNWDLPPRGRAVWSLRHENGFRVGLEFIL